MLIDCDGCAVRGSACTECVVTLMLGSAGDTRRHPGRDPRAAPVPLDRVDRTALRVLADAGLVPRLRHEPSAEPHEQAG